LIVLFALADLLIALIVWVPSQAPRMDLALSGFGASAGGMVVAEFNRLPAVQPLVAQSIMFDVMAIATCLMFLGLYVRDQGGFPPYRRTSNLVTSFVSHAAVVLLGASGAFVAFGLIGLPHYDALAAIVGASSMIPVAGPLTATAICGAVAMSLSASKVIATISYLIVYYELDSKVLRQHRHDADFVLSALALLVCLMLGMVVGRFTGALMGIGPVAVVLLLIVSRLEIDSVDDPEIDTCAKCNLALRLAGSSDFERQEAGVVYTGTGEIASTSVPFELALRVVATGIVTLVVLEFLHVRYPLILAGLAGTGNLVPIIGPLAATFACAVVAGADSTTRLIGVLVLFLILSQVAPLLPLKKAHGNYLNLQVLAVPAAVFLGLVVASIAISTVVIALTAGAFIWWVLAKNGPVAKSCK
jgi:predicted PurR-regulated permease PerM